MVPISMFDPRKGMQGQQAAIFAILLHILFNVLISILCFRLWLAALYIPEVLVLLALQFVRKR